MLSKGRQSKEKRPLSFQTARVRVRLRPNSFHQILLDCNLLADSPAAIQTLEILKVAAISNIPDRRNRFSSGFIPEQDYDACVELEGAVLFDKHCLCAT
jgi:hypothetical protein